MGKGCGLINCSFVVARQIVIITFNAFGLGFQKGICLRILDDFRHAMIDRPDGPTDTALNNTLIKTIRMQINVYLLMVLAYRAFHWDLLSRHRLGS